MPEFKSWRSYHNFWRAVRTDLRYVRSKEADEFLETVLATCTGREVEIKAERNFWRAQLGHDWCPIYEEGSDKKVVDDVECPHPSSRMKPLPNRAIEGRANPKGIPYLYLATEKETAMAEVRPWIGSLVSVGIFKVARDLKVIDCSRNHSDHMFYFDEPPPPERERAVWAAIDQAFAEPIDRSDDQADYAATQIIAELFKRNGYHGIAYKSALREEGYNIALFDIDAAALTYCALFKVTVIDFTFGEWANPYYIKPKAAER